MPDLALPSPGADLGDPESKFVAGLIQLGVSPSVAQGAISYATKNESGGDPGALNTKSGATAYMQWLGSRKKALLDKFGPSPSVENQVQHMQDELHGSESLTLARLKNARSPEEGYSIWGTSYERPGDKALRKAGLDPMGGPASRSQLSLAGSGFSGSNGAPQADFGQVRENALGALGSSGEAPASQAAPAEMDAGTAEAESPWQRLMMLSMISQLTKQGTHQFVKVDYDPWKIAAVGKREPA